MRIRTALFYFTVLFIAESCEQKENNNEKFNERNYSEYKRGKDGAYDYVTVLRNKNDSNYLLKYYYLDSGYTILVSKFFFYKQIPNGPYESFIDGKTFQKGYSNNNKDDGERLTYRNDKIVEKAYFKKGIKVGTWEEYNSKGDLINKKIFDDNGNLKDEQNFK